MAGWRHTHDCIKAWESTQLGVIFIQHWLIDSLRTEVIEAQIQIDQLEILLLSDGQSEPILRINDRPVAVLSLCHFDFDGQAKSKSLLFDDWCLEVRQLCKYSLKQKQIFEILNY